MRHCTKSSANCIMNSVTLSVQRASYSIHGLDAAIADFVAS